MDIRLGLFTLFCAVSGASSHAINSASSSVWVAWPESLWGSVERLITQRFGGQFQNGVFRYDLQQHSQQSGSTKVTLEQGSVQLQLSQPRLQVRMETGKKLLHLQMDLNVTGGSATIARARATGEFLGVDVDVTCQRLQAQLVIPPASGIRFSFRASFQETPEGWKAFGDGKLTSQFNGRNLVLRGNCHQVPPVSQKIVQWIEEKMRQEVPTLNQKLAEQLFNVVQSGVSELKQAPSLPLIFKTLPVTVSLDQTIDQGGMTWLCFTLSAEGAAPSSDCRTVPRTLPWKNTWERSAVAFLQPQAVLSTLWEVARRDRPRLEWKSRAELPELEALLEVGFLKGYFPDFEGLGDSSQLSLNFGFSGAGLVKGKTSPEDAHALRFDWKLPEFDVGLFLGEEKLVTLTTSMTAPIEMRADGDQFGLFVLPLQKTSVRVSGSTRFPRPRVEQEKLTKLLSEFWEILAARVLLENPVTLSGLRSISLEPTTQWMAVEFSPQLP